ncbi:hypothetical protein [Mycobacterium gordonae]|uniref:Uncharacterized protein n=1 Tax=Mycobacterium gordonae TaxID=1778 RepID=A0A1X1X108_MYCGO|nr:hypothetical protein [Mycobacterium gordonae]MCV7010473.1 hypothetical protein [Mycobacterium gordonae]ODR22541.1 hypothetical protein BHQ23_08495 [Mycobacterium gordonae]ORV92564.1 hypothetical protein AWC08_19590 [Mycobacterium gordonae]
MITQLFDNPAIGQHSALTMNSPFEQQDSVSKALKSLLRLGFTDDQTEASAGFALSLVAEQWANGNGVRFSRSHDPLGGTRGEMRNTSDLADQFIGGFCPCAANMTQFSACFDFSAGLQTAESAPSGARIPQVRPPIERNTEMPEMISNLQAMLLAADPRCRHRAEQQETNQAANVVWLDDWPDRPRRSSEVMTFHWDGK